MSEYMPYIQLFLSGLTIFVFPALGMYHSWLKKEQQTQYEHIELALKNQTLSIHENLERHRAELNGLGTRVSKLEELYHKQEKELIQSYSSKSDMKEMLAEIRRLQQFLNEYNINIAALKTSFTEKLAACQRENAQQCGG